jgi:phenylacetic acid degradation protein
VPAARPQVHPTRIVAPGALLIGRVTVEEGCFIGPNAVLRGDIEPVTILKGSNVQDNCVLHTHAGNPVTVGPHASLGHGAIVHGATVGERALIGMNAVVLDKAVVGERAVVGALTLVPQGFQVPPRSLAVGTPCRIVKQDDPAIAEMAFQNAERYHRYREEHLEGRYATLRGPFNDNGSFSEAKPAR